MNKKKGIVILIAILVIAGASTYGIIRYKHYANAERIRAEQRAYKEKREKARQEYVASENDEDPTPQIRIPNFKGMTLSEARQKIEDLGIKKYMESVQEVDSTEEKGIIVKSTPQQGSSFYEGELICFTFYVSKGNSEEN